MGDWRFGVRRCLGALPPRRKDAHPAFPSHAPAGQRREGGHAHNLTSGGASGARAQDTPLPPEAQLSSFLSELVLQVRKLRFYTGRSRKLTF